MLDELLDFIEKVAVWAVGGYVGFWALLFIFAIIAGNCSS